MISFELNSLEFKYFFSDQQACSSEDSSVAHNWQSVVYRPISLREEVLAVGLVVRLHLSPGGVGESALGQVVELVGPGALTILLEGEVHPVGVLSTVAVLVVVNHVEALAQHFSVHARVQSIPRDGEHGKPGQEITRILLLRQVL